LYLIFNFNFPFYLSHLIYMHTQPYIAWDLANLPILDELKIADLLVTWVSCSLPSCRSSILQSFFFLYSYSMCPFLARHMVSVCPHVNMHSRELV
jgi:hypothetical protein